MHSSKFTNYIRIIIRVKKSFAPSFSSPISPCISSFSHKQSLVFGRDFSEFTFGSSFNKVASLSPRRCIRQLFSFLPSPVIRFTLQRKASVSVREMAALLETTKIGELVHSKRTLISVPDTATIHEGLQTMLHHNIGAVPIAAFPGKWLGAGGSMVSDGHKQYIGFVSALDVVMHLGERKVSLESALTLPVTEFIGHSNEGMSMWVMNSQSSLLEAMEPMSKGVHRLMVQFPSSPSSSSSSTFRILSQTDVVKFLVGHVDEIEPIGSFSIESLGFLHPDAPPLAVSPDLPVLEAVRLMRKAGGVNAIAVVEPCPEPDSQLRNSQDLSTTGNQPSAFVRHGKILGTLSSSDFRGMDLKLLHKMAHMKVSEFLVHVSGVGVTRPPVTCRPSSPLVQVAANALMCKVHRVWITDEDDFLLGVVTFSDMIGAVRKRMFNFNT